MSRLSGWHKDSHFLQHSMCEAVSRENRNTLAAVSSLPLYQSLADSKSHVLQFGDISSIILNIRKKKCWREQWGSSKCWGDSSSVSPCLRCLLTCKCTGLLRYVKTGKELRLPFFFLSNCSFFAVSFTPGLTSLHTLTVKTKHNPMHRTQHEHYLSVPVYRREDIHRVSEFCWVSAPCWWGVSTVSLTTQKRTSVWLQIYSSSLSQNSTIAKKITCCCLI